MAISTVWSPSQCSFLGLPYPQPPPTHPSPQALSLPKSRWPHFCELLDTMVVMEDDDYRYCEIKYSKEPKILDEVIVS